MCVYTCVCSCMNDGFMDLEWIVGDRGVKSSTLLPVLLDEGSAKFVHEDFVKYEKTLAVRIAPTGPKGILAYDGEVRCVCVVCVFVCFVCVFVV